MILAALCAIIQLSPPVDESDGVKQQLHTGWGQPAGSGVTAQKLAEVLERWSSDGEHHQQGQKDCDGVKAAPRKKVL